MLKTPQKYRRICNGHFVVGIENIAPANHRFEFQITAAVIQARLYYAVADNAWPQAACDLCYYKDSEEEIKAGTQGLIEKHDTTVNALMESNVSGVKKRKMAIKDIAVDGDSLPRGGDEAWTLRWSRTATEIELLL